MPNYTQKEVEQLLNNQKQDSIIADISKDSKDALVLAQRAIDIAEGKKDSRNGSSSLLKFMSSGFFIFLCGQLILVAAAFITMQKDIISLHKDIEFIKHIINE